MKTREVRINRQVERAVEQILDRNAQGNTETQTAAYLTSLRLIANALEQEAHAVRQLADEAARL